MVLCDLYPVPTTSTPGPHISSTSLLTWEATTVLWHTRRERGMKKGCARGEKVNRRCGVGSWQTVFTFSPSTLKHKHRHAPYIQMRRHTFLYYTPNGATHPMQKWQLFVWHVFNHANTQTVQEVFHSKLVWDLLSSWLDTLYALLKDSKLVTCNTRVLTLRCFTAQHLKITNSLC